MSSKVYKDWLGPKNDVYDEVFKNEERVNELLSNSLKMYEDRFHPELIHEKLVKKMKQLQEC